MARDHNENFNKKDPGSLDLEIYLLIPVFFILLIIAAVESRAEAAEISLPTQMTQNFSEIQLESTAKKLNMNMTLEYASNLRKDSSPDKDDSVSLQLEPIYNFSKKSNLSLRLDMIQKLNDEKKSSFSNTLLVYTPIAIALNPEVQFKPKVSITLPTDETLRDEQSYLGTVSLRPVFEYIPTKIPGLILANTIYLNRNLHEYKTKSDYSPNIEYSVRNRFEVGYGWNEKWSIVLANDYVRSWTYGGYAREAFYFAQSLNYEFLKEWLVSFAHENEGSVRGPNSNGENVEIFNEKSSYVSMGVTHVF